MSQAPVVGRTHRGPHSSPSSLGSTISSLGRPVQRAEGEGRSHPRCLGGGCPPMEVLSSDSATPMSRPHWARAGFQALGVAPGVGEGTGFQRPGAGRPLRPMGLCRKQRGWTVLLTPGSCCWVAASSHKKHLSITQGPGTMTGDGRGIQAGQAGLNVTPRRQGPSPGAHAVSLGQGPASVRGDGCFINDF